MPNTWLTVQGERGLAMGSRFSGRARAGLGTLGVVAAVALLSACDPGHVVMLENGCGEAVEWRTSGNDRGTGSTWGELRPDAQEEVSSIQMEVDLLVRLPDDDETKIKIPWADYQEIADSAASLLRLEGAMCPTPRG